MAYVYSASLLPNTGADALFRLKTALVNVGWTVVSSSNGVSLVSGDFLTNASFLTASNAYYIIKQPLAATASYGGWQREFGIQRGAATNLTWKIDYTVSSSHQFGGTATVMASGADRKYVFESTAWQTAVVGTLFGTDGTYRTHILTANTAPFGFWMVSIPVGGGNPTAILFDPLLSGSFPANDPDPTIQWAQGDNNTFSFSTTANIGAANQATSSNAMTARGWLAKGSLSESYTGLQVPMLGIWTAGAAFGLANAAVGTNHIDSTDNLYPIYYLKTVAPGGLSSYKGISSLLSGNFTARNTGDTLSVVTTRDFIVFRHFVAFWDGSNPQI